MINVILDEHKVVDILINILVDDYNPEKEVVELFKKMYENNIINSGFESIDTPLDDMVGNDYINDCRVVYEGDDDYENIKKEFEEEGLGVSDYGIIEASNEDKSMFLVRY